MRAAFLESAMTTELRGNKPLGAGPMKRLARRMLQGAVALSVVASISTAFGAGGIQLSSVIAGTATITQSGALTAIHTGSQNTILNFQRLDVPAGDTLEFFQPTSTSRVLNRISGVTPTQIDGTVWSNGIVYFVNPSGVMFGKGAVIDASRFYAAAGNISDGDFLAGNDHFTGNTGAVNNSGLIQATEVHLVGGSVANFGQIYTTGAGASGIVTLTAGKDVYIGESTSPTGGASILVKVSNNTSSVHPGTGVTNTGTVNAGPGQIQMGAGDVYAAGIYNSGVLKGLTLSSNSGNSTNINTGTIDASNSAGKGGSVQLLGNDVGIDGGTVDASGTTGGGSIEVGGAMHGATGTPTASATYVDASATLKADATVQGNGGQVVVWSDQITRYYGNISAQGGPAGGNGGSVEVSGKQNLIFNGQVNTLAPAGTTGSLLLDPTTIDVNTAGTPVYTALSQVDQFADADGGGNDEIDPGLINGATTNVTLQANGNITFDSPVAMTHGNIGLTAQAGGNIIVNANITTKGGATGGAIVLSAGDSNSTTPTNGVITIAPGVTLDTTNGGGTNGADITLRAFDLSLSSTAVLTAGTGSVHFVTNTPAEIIDVIGTGVSHIAGDYNVEIANLESAEQTSAGVIIGEATQTGGVTWHTGANFIYDPVSNTQNGTHGVNNPDRTVTLTIDSGGPIVVDGNITPSTAADHLNAEFSGTSVEIGGSLNLAGTSAAELGVLFSGGAAFTEDASAAITQASEVDILHTGAISIQGLINLGISGTVRIAGSTVAESGSGAIDAGALGVESTSDITLNGANALSTLSAVDSGAASPVAITTTGNTNFSTVSGVSPTGFNSFAAVSGIQANGANVTVIAGGNISVTKSVTGGVGATIELHAATGGSGSLTFTASPVLGADNIILQSGIGDGTQSTAFINFSGTPVFENGAGTVQPGSVEIEQDAQITNIPSTAIYKGGLAPSVMTLRSDGANVTVSSASGIAGSNLTIDALSTGASISINTALTGANDLASLRMFSPTITVGANITTTTGSFLASSTTAVNLGGNVTVPTASNLTFIGPVTLTSNSTLVGGNVTFQGTVGSQAHQDFNLTVSPTTIAWFQGNVGGTAGAGNELGSLSVTSGTTQLGNGAAFSIVTLQSSAGGGTDGHISFAGPVQLFGNTTIDATVTTALNSLSAGQGDVTFSGTVDSELAQNFSLTVDSPGVTTFAQDVGATTPLSALTTDSQNGKFEETKLGSGGSFTINTTGTGAGGAIALNDPVVLQANAQITVGNTSATPSATYLTLGRLSGAFNLTTDSPGITLFAGGVSSTPGQQLSTIFSRDTSDATGTTEFGNGSSAIVVTTTGAQTYADEVLLVGDTTFRGSSLGFSGTPVSISAGAHNLTLASDSMTFSGGANSVQGTGDLTLEAFNDSDAIMLGTAGAAANTLFISRTDLLTFQAGFALITIGSPTATGTITVQSDDPTVPVEFSDPVAIQAPGTGGTIIVNPGSPANVATIPGLYANQALTLKASAITLNATIMTDGGNLTVNGPITLGTPGVIFIKSYGTDPTNLNVPGPNGGNIALMGTVDDDNSPTALQVLADGFNSGGNVDVQQAVGGIQPLNGFAVVGASVTIHADIRTTNAGGSGGDIILDDNTLTLVGNANPSTPTTITFKTDASGGTQDAGQIELGLSPINQLAGNGPVTLVVDTSGTNGHAGQPITMPSVGASQALGGLTLIAGTGNVSVADVTVSGVFSSSGAQFSNTGEISAGSVSLNHTGLASINEPIDATGTVGITAVGITTGTGDTISGSATTLAGGTGDVTLGATVTGTGAVVISGKNFSNAAEVSGVGASLTMTGSVMLNAPISGGAGAVNISGDGITSIAGATIGGGAITLASGAGDMTLGDTVTGTGAVVISGKNFSNAAEVSGVGASLTMTGSVMLNAPISGGTGLVNISGDGITNIAGATIGGGAVTLAGGAGNVILGDTVTATSGNVNISGDALNANATITGANITLDMTGLATISGDLDATGGVVSITAAGAADPSNVVKAGTLTLAGTGVFAFTDASNQVSNLGGATTGAITLDDSSALTLGTSSALTTGNGNLTITVTGPTLTIHQAVNAGTGVISLTAPAISDPSGALTGGAITLTANAGTDSIGGAITGSGPLVITGTAVTLSNSATGTSVSITASSGSVTTDALTATTGAITISGPATVTGNLSSAGAVSFDSTLNITGNVTATGAFTVTGNATLAGTYTAASVGIPSAVTLGGTVHISTSGAAGIMLGSTGNITGNHDLTLINNDATSKIIVGAMGTSTSDRVGDVDFQSNGEQNSDQLLGNIFANSVSFTAVGGGGLHSIPVIATVFADAATLTNHTLIIDTNGSFFMASKEALAVHDSSGTGGNLDIESHHGTLTVADVAALGNLKLSAPAAASGSIVFQARAGGSDESHDGTSQPDHGTEIVGGTSISIIGDVSVAGPGGDKVFIGAPDASNVLDNSPPTVLRFAPGSNTRIIPIDQSPAVTEAELVSTGTDFLKVLAQGDAGISPVATVGAVIPRDIQTLTPEEGQSISGALRDILEQLGINARDVRPDEIISFLLHHALYDDVPVTLNPGLQGTTVAVNRLPYDPVLATVQAYDDLYLKPVPALDDDGKPIMENGKPKTTQQYNLVKSAFQAAWEAYVQDLADDATAKGFRTYLEAHEKDKGEFAAALAYLNQLRDLLQQIKSVGVTPAELDLSERVLLQKVQPRGVRDFADAVNGPTSRGAGVAVK